MGGAKDFWEGHETGIDWPHFKTHEGKGYFFTYTSALTATQVMEIRIQTPDTAEWAHIMLSLQTALKATFALFETTTFTYVTANAIPVFNRNRNSALTSSALVCDTPGGSGDGTKLAEIITGGAAANGKANAGGFVGERTELVLKQNTAYLLRVTSGAASNTMGLVADWYEHEFKP